MQVIVLKINSKLHSGHLWIIIANHLNNSGVTHTSVHLFWK